MEVLLIIVALMGGALLIAAYQQNQHLAHENKILKERVATLSNQQARLQSKIQHRFFMDDFAMKHIRIDNETRQ